MFSPCRPSQRQHRHLRGGGNPRIVSGLDQAPGSSALHRRKWSPFDPPTGVAGHAPESSAIRGRKRSRREAVAAAGCSFVFCVTLAAAGAAPATAGSTLAAGSAPTAAGSAPVAAGSASVATGSTLVVTGSALAAAGSALAAAGSTLAAAGSTLAAAGSMMAAPDEVRELAWEELMPQGWNPLDVLDALMGADRDDPDALSDNSVRAIELLNAYQEAVRSAPVVRELDGRKIRLPGFVVPLDFEGTEISEFLLVPYFGACIHVPPPPANQIVYVKTVASYPLQGLFDPVWVTGKIRTDAYPNDLGDAGYTLQATIIEPY